VQLQNKISAVKKNVSCKYFTNSFLIRRRKGTERKAGCAELNFVLKRLGIAAVMHWTKLQSLH